MISDYDSLQDAIGTQLQRTEFSSSGTRSEDTETCIDLAEKELNELFETRQMETRSTTDVSTQYVVLPDDWGGLRSLKIDGYAPLTYLTPDVGDRRFSTETGRPLYYSIIGEQLKFWPTPDAEYTVEALHYLKVPSLSDSNTTNWLLERRPDIYLNGTLKYLQGYYLMDTERAVLAHQAMMLGVDQLESADKRRRWGSQLKTAPNVMIV